MYDLFTRTTSQGLQALLPIAFCWIWFRRARCAHALDGLKWGLAAALPATVAAAYWFQASTHQAHWEAALAAATLAPAIWFARRIRRGLRDPGRTAVGLSTMSAMSAVLVVTRQTMEIAIVFALVLQVRSLDALVAWTGSIATALVVVGVWVAIARRLPDAALARATRIFALLFIAQLAIYAFHESAEAHLLPWSAVLHAATEPYGPDGIYGRYMSALLFVVPLAAALATVIGNVIRARVGPVDPVDDVARRRARVAQAAFAVVLLAAAGVGLVGTFNADRSVSYAAADPAPPPAHDISTIAAGPHLMFRHTAIDQNYGRLSIAPLDAPADRAPAAFTCERVSFAAGRGICLAADRGMFTSYKIVFFDRPDNALRATRSVKLAGSPSRTRISSDGRVGAVTVFVTGWTHGYAGASFSTRTSILDMAAGDELGDLEQFTTWRDGVRFKAADFNFWGVTFARDSNVFYATLRTASTTLAGAAPQATTYLVRGDLGLRKLTVLRENVECPSLSPNNRLIAFKKRVGSGLQPWRLHVLDVATLVDRPIAAETRSIDDQVEWLDDSQVLYAVPRANPAAIRDVWVAPVDGSAPARVFLPEAESPIVVR